MMQVIPSFTDGNPHKADAICSGSDLSDEQLIALCHIYLSRHEKAVCVRRDDEADKRTQLQHQLAELFGECYHRCSQSNDLLRLARLAPLLYQLANPIIVPVNCELLSKCDAVAERSTDLWMEQESSSWEEEHGMMRLVIELSGAMEEPEQEPLFQKYKKILAGWNQTLSGNKKWEGISDRETQSRLAIMHRHFNMLSANAYAEDLSLS